MTHIGIDTGVHTGVAVWDGRDFRVLRTCGIIEALELVGELAARESVKVYFEDARQRKWIPKEKSLSQYKGRAMGAGSVKRDAQVWEEFLTRHGIPYEAVPPKRNRTKVTALFFQHLTGYYGRTSEHSRDAAMLVFGK